MVCLNHNYFEAYSANKEVHYQNNNATENELFHILTQVSYMQRMHTERERKKREKCYTNIKHVCKSQGNRPQGSM